MLDVTIANLYLVDTGGDDDLHRPSVLGRHASLPFPLPSPVFLHSMQKFEKCTTFATITSWLCDWLSVNIGSLSQLSGWCGGPPPWCVVPPPLLLPLLNHSQPGLGRQRGARILQFLDVAGVRTLGLSNLHNTREQNIR